MQLQDFFKAQAAIMAGFTSFFAGTTQQDEIATILRSCLARGGDIFGHQLEPAKMEKGEIEASARQGR
jgi:hypothetical protein